MTQGVPRQDHYGAGRQPWDDILDAGWAPEFAAGNVLKYLRRSKDPEHSLEAARWYYARLLELSRGELPSAAWESSRSGPRLFIGRACAVRARLEALLTSEEKHQISP